MKKGYTKKEIDEMKKERTGKIFVNNDGCEFKVIEYNNSSNVLIEFQDEYKYTVRSTWRNIESGKIKNPFFARVYNVGIVGCSYPISKNRKHVKEYQCWCDMLYRYSEEFKENNPTYSDVEICKDWFYYPNFYEWLHSQENFDKWYNGKRWCLDKDILYKYNKLYSPETCCLVPNNVNTLFVKKDANRGELPIGVAKNHDRYMVKFSNPIKNNAQYYVGTYNTPNEAFDVYKFEKENVIKQVAKEEYSKGNITKRCYDAMMNYKVEITD